MSVLKPDDAQIIVDRVIEVFGEDALTLSNVRYSLAVSQQLTSI